MDINDVIIFRWTPLFKSYMVRVVVKSIQQINTCRNAIGLCAHNIDNVLGSILNTIDQFEKRKERESPL